MSSFCLWFMLISSLSRANSSWLHGFNPRLIQCFLAWSLFLVSNKSSFGNNLHDPSWVLFNGCDYVALLQLSQKCATANADITTVSPRYSSGSILKDILCSGAALVFPSNEHRKKKKERKKSLKVPFFPFFFINFVSPCLAGGRSS